MGKKEITTAAAELDLIDYRTERDSPLKRKRRRKQRRNASRKRVTLG